MSDEKRPSVSQRRVVLALVLVLIAVIGTAFYAVRYRNAVARAPLVGTWKGEPGNILNLRPDGTARVRHSFPTQEFAYFEWTFNAGEFVFYQYRPKNSLRVWYFRILRATVGMRATERYEVIEASPTRLKLRTDTGQVLTFTATADPELESAP